MEKLWSAHRHQAIPRCASEVQMSWCPLSAQAGCAALSPQPPRPPQLGAREVCPLPPQLPIHLGGGPADGAGGRSASVVLRLLAGATLRHISGFSPQMDVPDCTAQGARPCSQAGGRHLRHLSAHNGGLPMCLGARRESCKSLKG